MCQLFPLWKESKFEIMSIFFKLQSFLFQTTALRVQVTAMDADEEYPVLFVVRQQRQILSWQVPLMLETL